MNFYLSNQIHRSHHHLPWLFLPSHSALRTLHADDISLISVKQCVYVLSAVIWSCLIWNNNDSRCNIITFVPFCTFPRVKLGKPQLNRVNSSVGKTQLTNVVLSSLKVHEFPLLHFDWLEKRVKWMIFKFLHASMQRRIAESIFRSRNHLSWNRSIYLRGGRSDGHNIEIKSK